MQITFRPFCQSLEFGDVVSRKFKNCQDRKDIISYVNLMNILYTNSTLFFNVLFGNFLEEKHGEGKVKGRKGEGAKYKERNCQASNFWIS